MAFYALATVPLIEQLGVTTLMSARFGLPMTPVELGSYVRFEPGLTPSTHLGSVMAIMLTVAKQCYW